MLINTGKKINNPQKDQVVFFQPWMGKTDKRKKPYPVIINFGSYLDGISSRISNFWYWQRLTPTGRIRKEIEKGYGNFTVAEGYILTRKVIVTKSTN